MEIGETFVAARPQDFRSWLRRNHRTKAEIWLVLFKKSTGKATITLDQAIEEAIAYGWIDNMSKGMDAERYAVRFSPRRPGSHWTDGNLAIARRMESEGRMTEAGRKVLPKAPGPSR